MKAQIKILLSLFIFSSVLVSCEDGNESGNEDGTTRVEIRLTDSPALYEEVNIDIQAVSIHVTNDENSGWQEFSLIKPGIYNLLDFQNGIDTLLAAQDIPSGKISQIRFVLGANNTIVKDGTSYDLETPSEQTSGLKLNLHDNLIAGMVYRLWIDFDASRSVMETGSGKYKFKPVIRTYTEALGGTLQGTVLPLEAQASVVAIQGTDTLAAYPNTDGFYRISGLSPNSSWTVKFDANTGYKDSIRTGVSITQGSITTINVTLNQ